jgi:hypothetical protein
MALWILFRTDNNASLAANIATAKRAFPVGGVVRMISWNLLPRMMRMGFSYSLRTSCLAGNLGGGSGDKRC